MLPLGIGGVALVAVRLDWDFVVSNRVVKS